MECITVFEVAQIPIQLKYIDIDEAKFLTFFLSAFGFMSVCICLTNINVLVWLKEPHYRQKQSSRFFKVMLTSVNPVTDPE